MSNGTPRLRTVNAVRSNPNLRYTAAPVMERDNRIGESLDEYLSRQSDRVSQWLDRLVPPESAEPSVLHRAMRYSLLAGGKRLRPALCIAAGEAFGADESDLLAVACSLEMIHTYSLIHDDLPSMDDDDFRRGRPTCHRAFGEATAILAGDALMTLAFRTLAISGIPAGRESIRLQTLADVSAAAGTPGGMVAGQVLDLEGEHTPVDAAGLDRLHAAKTGALLTVSVTAGARCGDVSEGELDALRRFGAGLGLAFQIADDVLDVTGTSEELGKTPGKDVASGKSTYPGLYGIDGSRERARATIAKALQEIESFGERVERLRQIACFVIERRK
jgi:geranylgeranyl diphosphate synthase type II